MAEVIAVGDVGDVVEEATEIPVRRIWSVELLSVAETSTVAVVAGASTGVELAQRVQAKAPNVTVVYVAADEEQRQVLRAQLATAPSIGRHTTCVLPGTGSLGDELHRARLRFEHHCTMRRAQSLVGDLVPLVPETAPVYLGQLFQHAPVGILLVGPDGVVVAMNRASRDTLDAGAVALPGRAFTDLGVPDEAARVVAECLHTGTAGQVTVTMSDPGAHVVELRATPVDPDRLELGAFVLLNDETERIRALEEAEGARLEAQSEADRYAELARTLQESLLPPDLPAVPGVAMAARFHPAGDGSELGGDFYDVFQISDSEWFAVIGDVCGKGAGAARLTALTRYTLRAVTVRTRTIERNLADLNAALGHQYVLDRERGEHRFATVAAVRFGAAGPGTVELDAGSGGHPPPIVVRRSGRIEEMEARGSLLGVFPSGRFRSARTRLEEGDVLVLYTDGVTEAGPPHDQFGEDRLHDLLRGVAGDPPDRVAGAIEQAVLDHQSGVARDDIAVLAFGPT